MEAGGVGLSLGGGGGGGGGQLFSLKWNNYLNHIMDAFEILRNEENLVDVTLSCEGYKIKAHKMLLSACSSYFKDLFKDNPCKHPIVVFRNVKFYDLRALVDFIYQGEVNVLQDQLPSFLSTAKFLEVKGLTDNNFNSAYEPSSAANLDSESYEEENFGDSVDNEDAMVADDEENESDVSQYAQTTYLNRQSSAATSAAASCPLSIIPISRSTSTELSSPSYDYSTTKRKRRHENDESYHRNRFLQNARVGGQRNSIELSNLTSFANAVKQSVEIFPLPAVKTEKVGDSYGGGGTGGSERDRNRIDRSAECEIQSINIESSKLRESIVAAAAAAAAGTTSMNDSYVRSAIEMNHILSKSSLSAPSDSEISAQDSFQGHWLSSLNNGGDGGGCASGGEGTTVEMMGGSGELSVTMTSSRKSATSVIDSNIDYSQQRHRYICNICGATYKHLRNLRAHCHLHYGKTRCNLCNKVLCNISYFKKHLQQQHGLLTTKKNDPKNLASSLTATTTTTLTTSTSPSPSIILNAPTASSSSPLENTN